MQIRSVVFALALVLAGAGASAQVVRLARQAVDRPDSERLAVLIQDGPGGPLIGAAWIGM